MSDSYLGQLMLFAGNFAPSGWLPCDCRVLPINQYTALFSLVGNYFPGGNGTTTFALPDLRGRVPVGVGNGTGLSGYTLGQMGGAETVALNTSQMPSHTHTLQAANTAGDSPGPTGTFLSTTNDVNSGNTYNTYNSTLAPQVAMGATSIGSQGGSQGHPNLQPFTALQWCICNQGIYPSRP